MQAQGVVELGHQVGGNAANDGTESCHRNRTNLFSLGFRIQMDACFMSGEEDLEGEDPRDVAGDGYHGDDASTQRLPSWNDA